MNTRVLVLMAAFSLAMTAVAFVPEASAHYCRGLNPLDCGSCTSGDHDHQYCNSHTTDILSDLISLSEIA